MINSKLAEVTQLDIDSLYIIYQAIGSGFDRVMREVTERESYGTGARQRTIDELAHEFDSRKSEILKIMADSLRMNITEILRSYAKDLRVLVINLKKNVLKSILESGGALMLQVDRPKQKEIAERLNQALTKIPESSEINSSAGIDFH